MYNMLMVRRILINLTLLFSSALLLFNSPIHAQTPTFSVPRDPVTFGFTPLKYITNITNCPQTVSPEFHPLRPYPASPCDPLIPRKTPEAPAAADNKYLTFSCANSLNTHGSYTVLDVVPRNLIGQSFNPCTADLENSNGDTFAYQNYYLCGGQVCLVHPVTWHTNVGLENSKFPIISNTQEDLDDEVQVNLFLDWYLSGTVQSSEHIPLNPDNPNEMVRLNTYSGPVNKLLPRDSQLDLRTALLNGPVEKQYHNYIVGCRESRTVAQIVNAVLTCLKAAASNLLTLPRLAYLAARMVAQDLIQVIQAIPHITQADFASPASLAAALIREGLTVLGNDGQFVQDFLKIGFQPIQNLRTCLSALILDEVVNCGGPGAKVVRLNGVSLNSAMMYQVPYSSREDVTGESTISFIPDVSFQPDSDGYLINSCPGRNPSLIIDNAGELSDSRLYFPGLKSSNALTEISRSFYLPLPPTPTRVPDTSSRDFVSQRISEHQGIDDSTVVQRPDYLKSGLPTRNTEVIPGALAPNPLFRPDPPSCELSDARSSPGDNLVGSSIGSTLTYHQVFQYTPEHLVDFPLPCAVENAGCTPDRICCWGECQGYQPGGCYGPYPICKTFGKSACENYPYPGAGLCEWQDEEPGKCEAWPRRELNSNTRISVFIKTPLVERLYDSLVVGADSLLRRFLPKKPDILGPGADYLTGEHDIETTVPGQDTAQYSGSTSNLNNPRVDSGSGGAPADIYFDRLGSLADHFLGGAVSYENLNFQRLWRPLDIIDAYSPPIGTKGINCNKSRPLQAVACVNRANYIDVARRWYGLPTQGYPYAEECFNDAVFLSNQAGVNPALVLLIWMNESDTSNYLKIGNVSDFGMVFYPHNNWLAQITAFINFVKQIKSTCSAEIIQYGWARVFAAKFSYNTNLNKCIPTADTDEYAQNITNTTWDYISSCPFPAP